MSITVEEVKDNGNYNLQNAVMDFQIVLGNNQLENYNIAIKLGANDNDDWNDWEEKVEEHKRNGNV